MEDYTRNNSYFQKNRAVVSHAEARGEVLPAAFEVDAEGRETNVDELQIDYIMGSGNHVRTYLHGTPRGTLIELPLGWYPEHGGTWAMNPGYSNT